MRRFSAFIIMVVSIVAAIIFNTQAVMDGRLLSLEYGGGRELVYSLTQREGGQQVNAEKIGDNILNRLDKAGIRNADIELVGNDQIRITFAAQTTNDYNNARTLIEANGSLTVCTYDDWCISGSRFFKNNVASVYYSGMNGYPGLNIKNTDVYNEIKTHASEASDSNQQSMIYVWENKLDSDTYQGAFGDDPDEEMAKKVIGAIDISKNYNENLNALILGSNASGVAFTTSTARAWVNARNAEDYGVNISYLYENNVDASFGAKAMNYTLLASGIALSLIAILLCIYYGFSGLIASVSIGGGILIDILVFSFLGFEFSPAALIGMVVTVALGIYISINYFERVKDELSKGRVISKANQEGYRKSFAATLDSCAIVFFVALFGFLIGKGVIKTFGGVVTIGALAMFLITNYLNKWMMYWLTTSSTFAKNNGGFGLKVKKEPENVKNLYAEGKSKKTLVKGGIVAAAIVVASVASLIGFGVTGNMYSLTGSYTGSGRIDIKTTDETYLDKKSFIEDFDQKGWDIEYTDVTFNRIEGTDEYDETYYTTYISIATEKLVNDPVVVSELTDMFVEKDDNATVSFNKVKPSGIDHTVNSIYLVLGLTAVFATVYLLLRYGIFVALAALSDMVVSGLLGVAIPVLFRLPFNVYTGFGYLGAMFVISFASISLFARNKDVIKDSKVKKPTSEQRAEILDQSRRLTLITVLGCGIAVTILSIVGAAIIGEEMLSTFIIFLITSAVGFALIYFLVAPLYIVVRTRIKLKVSPKVSNFFAKVGEKLKKVFHINGKKKVVVNKNEARETVVPGINEYR